MLALRNYLLLFGRFQIDLDRDLIADDGPTGFQHCTPAQAKILAIDRGLRVQASALVAIGIFHLTRIFGVEEDLFGHTMNRQVAQHTIFIAADWLDLFALERNSRECFSVEEIS